MREESGNFRRELPSGARLQNVTVRFIHFIIGLGSSRNLRKEFGRQCQEMPVYRLVTDLKARVLLKDTLVVWGGEFGRTNYSQGKLTSGRFMAVIIIRAVLLFG